MNKPRLLDAFCRKGGAGMGYIQAGFDVVGVDIEDHSNGYPGTFIQGDAVEYIRNHGNEFAAIHASPPCQNEIAITAGNRARDGWTDDHEDWVTPTRAELHRLAVPSIIENGRTAKSVRPDIVLCGEMFGLGVQRHRSFELHRWFTFALPHPQHRGYVRGYRHGEYRDGPYVAVYGKGGDKATVPEAQAAMGIDWMTRIEDLNEAVPPAYTRWLGERLLEYLAERAA